ncbi:hypothetical protein D3C86_968850 [compost metagenome]
MLNLKAIRFSEVITVHAGDEFISTVSQSDVESRSQSLVHRQANDIEMIGMAGLPLFDDLL